MAREDPSSILPAWQEFCGFDREGRNGWFSILTRNAGRKRFRGCMRYGKRPETVYTRQKYEGDEPGGISYAETGENRKRMGARN